MVTLARANDDVSPCTLDMRLYLTDPDSDGGRGGSDGGRLGKTPPPPTRGREKPPHRVGSPQPLRRGSLGGGSEGGVNRAHMAAGRGRTWGKAATYPMAWPKAFYHGSMGEIDSPRGRFWPNPAPGRASTRSCRLGRRVYRYSNRRVA